MKIFTAILILFVFASCRSTHEIFNYEFSQSRQLTAHFEFKKFANVLIHNDKKTFEAQIIDGFYNNGVFLNDTVNIKGYFVKSRKVYKLVDSTDDKVSFKIRSSKNKIWLKGIYATRYSSYSTIKNKSEF